MTDHGHIFKLFMGRFILHTFTGPLRNAMRAIARHQIREAHPAWPQAKRSLPFFRQPLKEALDESNIPYRVDLHVWDEVPERFHEIIRSEYLALS
jgi:hypothetical protein